MKMSPTGRFVKSGPVMTFTGASFHAQSIGAALAAAGLIKSVEDKLVSQGLVKVAEGSDWSEWASKVDLSELELRMLTAHPELAGDPYLLGLPSPVAGSAVEGMTTCNSDGSSKEA